MGKLAKKAFKTVGKIAGGVLGGGIIGSIMGGKKNTVAPEDPRQTPMPEPDDEAVRRARKRSVAQQTQRQGRLSTILTDGSDKLGG